MLCLLVQLLDPKLAQHVRGQLGCAEAGENAVWLMPPTRKALCRGEVPHMHAKVNRRRCCRSRQHHRSAALCRTQLIVARRNGGNKNRQTKNQDYSILE